jgi:hypothetical protein
MAEIGFVASMAPSSLQARRHAARAAAAAQAERTKYQNLIP